LKDLASYILRRVAKNLLGTMHGPLFGCYEAINMGSEKTGDVIVLKIRSVVGGKSMVA
jgi:hypothetical protein